MVPMGCKPWISPSSYPSSGYTTARSMPLTRQPCRLPACRPHPPPRSRRDCRAVPIPLPTRRPSKCRPVAAPSTKKAPRPPHRRTPATALDRSRLRSINNRPGARPGLSLQLKNMFFTITYAMKLIPNAKQIHHTIFCARVLGEEAGNGIFTTEYLSRLDQLNYHRPPQPGSSSFPLFHQHQSRPL